MTTRRWSLAHGRSLELGARAQLMGILNVTPDSFSDGGRYVEIDEAVAQALRMAEEGASIIDIGGESTRPGATEIDAREEQARVLPVIRALRERSDVLISIDTYRAETARLAVEAGANIVNDVHGLQREPDIADVAAETGAGIVIMHTGRGREKLPDVIGDQFAFLNVSLEIARQRGIRSDQIVLDPGFGFAKECAGECRPDGPFSGTLGAWPPLADRHLSQTAARASHRPRPGESGCRHGSDQRYPAAGRG